TQPRQTDQPTPTADRGLGPGIRLTGQLPAGIPGTAATQAGTRPGRTPAPTHRARDGLPVRALRCDGRGDRAGGQPGCPAAPPLSREVAISPRMPTPFSVSTDSGWNCSDHSPGPRSACSWPDPGSRAARRVPPRAGTGTSSPMLTAA